MLADLVCSPMPPAISRATSKAAKAATEPTTAFLNRSWRRCSRLRCTQDGIWNGFAVFICFICSAQHLAGGVPALKTGSARIISEGKLRLRRQGKQGAVTIMENLELRLITNRLHQIKL